MHCYEHLVPTTYSLFTNAGYIAHIASLELWLITCMHHNSLLFTPYTPNQDHCNYIPDTSYYLNHICMCARKQMSARLTGSLESY